tara:strand:+ start:859 stop:1062 length:204 start_codon:yes stop_codon:yes gene_type:complete
VATKQLDLHGVKHEEAERLVENFVLLNKPPLKIITGNSDKMRNIVQSICGKHGICYERWDWGEFTIF